MEQVNIVITESAYDDLLDIETYISQDSELIARNFINKIFDKIDQLYKYPTSGKFVPEIADRSIRELLLNKYRIIYQIVDDKNINVLRIVHGARLLDIEL
ncbi:addiction module RelE/StbE family toxin [Mucilaginibacter sp. SG538B]|uniref:type II toxin-antitoxin system RelE/ParE family toxin n=1 Tax=Mucilaginibacter sp. SG538B TaxID=2587021 RepID=UPI00159D8210|nr:type II toxin-antitoxin system RelE/ParE family toxin [Mucilaginibacter sp. SG538B]NVM66288.1 addiction module RelE/StbE family toxin [Mucilaginibacter sp. SG538B]